LAKKSATVRRKEHLSSAVTFDPLAGRFVKVTYGPAGRILSRTDLDPIEKRDALRRLFATRASRDERYSACNALDSIGLIVVTAAGTSWGNAGGTPADVLSARFVAARRQPDVIALAEALDVSESDVLTLAWAVNFALAQAGQALPRLEDVDADLPFVPPFGLGAPACGFDAGAVVEEAEAEILQDGSRLAP